MTPRSPSSSGSACPITKAARRMTLKVPIRLTWMTWENIARSCGADLRWCGGPPDAGAIHHHARYTELLDHGLDRCLGVGPVGDIGLDEEAANFGRLGIPQLVLKVEDRDLGARRRQRRRRCAAQSRCAAGDDGSLPFDVHPGLPVGRLYHAHSPCQNRPEPPNHEVMSEAGGFAEARRWCRASGKGTPDPGPGAVHRRRCRGLLLRHRRGGADNRSAPPCWARSPHFVLPFDAIPGFFSAWASPTMPRCCSPPSPRQSPHHRSPSRTGARLAAQAEGGDRAACCSRGACRAGARGGRCRAPRR